ncbi:ABC transporter substrate-binding protein [Magnetospirillum sp. UT-4]|uniref:substrate-binding periplasmic protein n=1 Tax=Magnetospirillum sp. UT-4 TaxID=2681467 RepID=UPI0013848165|nr:transporter substrate-binding domain-containing protein [Magnetospirillum sp. UT-4]CAA7616942.1 ABC transporter, periplasmic domain [Magnetospirillum sp. UT-4]
MVVRRFAALLSLVAALAATTARADTISLRADEWCPFNCAGTPAGYGVDVMVEIFAKAGHRVDYALAPWGRAQADCSTGRIAAVIGADPKENPDLVFPQEPIGRWDTTFVVRKGNAWRYDGPGSLPNVRLSGVIGYAYMDPVGAYVEANKGDRSRVDLIGSRHPLEQNLKKLLAGRIDATMDSRTVLDFKLGQMGLADQVEFAGSTRSDVVYIAFSPRHPKARDYARLLDDGIREMRASGRLRQILAGYGVQDWK